MFECPRWVLLPFKLHSVAVQLQVEVVLPLKKIDHFRILFVPHCQEEKLSSKVLGTYFPFICLVAFMSIKPENIDALA